MSGVIVHRLLSRLRRDNRGQALVELALLLPVLLVTLLGLVELARVMDATHQLRTLAREGASLAGRGVPLDSVVVIVMAGGASMDLANRGGAVASEVEVESDQPIVQSQSASAGYSDASALGAPGEQATVLNNTLLDEQSVGVVEVFFDFETVTPSLPFIGDIVPSRLYERAIF